MSLALAAPAAIILGALAAVIPFTIVLALGRYLIARADRRVRQRRADAAAAALAELDREI
jgi:hypothetical protein